MRTSATRPRLAALCKATHLRWLGIAFTNLPPAAADTLLAALPHCVVRTGVLKAHADGSVERLLADRRAAAAR